MSRSHDVSGSRSTALRALWLVRENLQTHPGGDTTQILQTRAGLERLGVSVDFACDLPAQLESYDVVHLFHLDRLWEHLGVCRRLRAARTPAVLSTIYWPTDEFDQRARAGGQGALARLLGTDRHQTLRLMQRFALDAARTRRMHRVDRRLLSFRQAVRFLLETVDVILPNSVAEREQIAARFGIVRPAVVVPNAADTGVFAPGSASVAQKRLGVLCVGRIEPRKNQLALIEALRDTQIPLTLVGQAGRFSAGYARACNRMAGPNVRFVDHRSATELRELYHAAHVHACVSWYETPGLASLEAALCGCNPVVTPGGCTREYFGNAAQYCKPDDVGSIRRAVENALARRPDPALALRVAGEFNWDAAARATRAAYEQAIEMHRV